MPSGMARQVAYRYQLFSLLCKPSVITAQARFAVQQQEGDVGCASVYRLPPEPASRSLAIRCL